MMSDDDESMGVASVSVPGVVAKLQNEQKQQKRTRDQRDEQIGQSDEEQRKEKKKRKSNAAKVEGQSEQKEAGEEDASRIKKKKSKKEKNEKKEKSEKKKKRKRKESESDGDDNADEDSADDESSASSDDEKNEVAGGDLDSRRAAKAQRKADRAERRRLKALKRDLRTPMSREQSGADPDDPSVESVHYRKKGSFTPREKQVVQAALEQYAASHGLEKSDMDRLLGRRRLKEHVGVFKEIAQCLPLRQYHSVYEHIVRTGSVVRNRREAGVWPPEDVENLKRLYEEYGPKWSKIGVVLNRTDKDVRDKYRTISRDFKTGMWTKEETQRLSLWVHKQAALGQQYRGDVVLQPDGISYATTDGTIITPPERGILWTAISQIMKDRSHMQCRKHWYDTLAPKLKFAALNQSTNAKSDEAPAQSSDDESPSQPISSRSSNATVSVHQWTLEEDKVLLEKLYAQGAESVFEVDWNSLTNARFPLPHMVRAHFIWLRERLTTSKSRFAHLAANAEGKFDELVRKIRKHLWERQQPHQMFYLVPQQRPAPVNDAEKQEREKKFAEKQAEVRREKRKLRRQETAVDEESKEGDADENSDNDDDDDSADDLERRRAKEEADLQSSRAEARRAAETQAKLHAEQGQQAKQAAAEKRRKEQQKREKKLLKQNKLVSLAEKRRQEAIQAAVAARNDQGKGEEKENKQDDEEDERGDSSSDSDDGSEFRSQATPSSKYPLRRAMAASAQASQDISTQPITQSSRVTPLRPARSSAATTAAAAKKRTTSKPVASQQAVQF